MLQYRVISNLPYGYVIQGKKFFRWQTLEHLDTVQDCLAFIAEHRGAGKEYTVKIYFLITTKSYEIADV